MMYNDNSQRGFTLVEVLVAISILLTAIAATMGVLANGSKVGNASDNQTIATYIAMDGVEKVRAIRDRNLLHNLSSQTQSDWLKSVDNLCLNNNLKCYVDSDAFNYANLQNNSNQTIIKPCPGSNCSPLIFNSNRGYITSQFDSTRSIFTREIYFAEVTTLGQDQAIKVIVRVEWQNPSGDQELMVVEILFNQ